MRAVGIRREDRTGRHEVHFGPAEKMFAVELPELELAACCDTAAVVPPVVVVVVVVVVALPASEHPGQFDVANGAELGGRTLVPQLQSVAEGSEPAAA